MAMTPEGKVKHAVKKLLKSYDDQVWYFIPVSAGYGVHGVPDIIACVCGQFVAIECKATAKQKPTQRQQFVLSSIAQAGGSALVINIDNVDFLKRVIDGVLKDAGWVTPKPK